MTGADAPFELVLGQSVNKGWQAVAEPGRGARAGSHAVDLGPPQLVDGFANGWHVTASDLAAVGGSNFTVTFTWTPQSEIWAALALSAGTLLLCLLVGFLPVRWRRALRGRLPRRLRGTEGPDAPERPGAPFDATELALPTSADRSAGARPRGVWLFVRALLIGAVTGAIALLVVPPLAGLAVGVVVMAGLLVPWLRAVATVGGVAFIVAGCLNVVRGQQVHHYMPGSNWDGSFVNAGNLVWLGAVLLLADAVISAFGWRPKKPLGGRALRAGTGPLPGSAPDADAEAMPRTAAEVGPEETSEESEDEATAQDIEETEETVESAEPWSPRRRPLRAPNRKEHPRTPPRRRRPIRQARPEKCPWSPRRRPLRGPNRKECPKRHPGRRRSLRPPNPNRIPRNPRPPRRRRSRPPSPKECPRRSPSRPRPIRQPRPKRLPLPRQLPGRHPR